MNSNATVKFVQPTLEDGSRILCRQGEICRVLMYTSFASNRLSCKAINTSLALNTSSIGSCGNFDKDNDEEDPDTVARSKDPCCVDVVSASGVTIFPAHPRGPSCVSEAAFSFVSEGEKDICFMSALTDSQQLCYKVGVYNYSSDPCSSSPCLNNGHCFHTDHQNYTCLCPDHYVGNRCERGPCQIVDNNCQNGAYCQTNAGVNTCICRAGFSGVTCSRGTSGVNRNFEEFKDTAIPTTVPCRIYQQCSMTLFLAGTPGYIPTVSYGFVDRTLFLYNITTTERPSFQNSYQTDIHFKTSSIGLKYLCIQIKDHNGVNKDEICLKVSVTSDVLTTYGVKDRPHFVDPSLSNAAELECMVENPCHIIYHVTSGQGNENKCITYNIQSQDAFVGYHLFSSCDDCKVGIKGYSSCSIDISLVNYIGDVGAKRHLCLTLGLKGSTDTGETRCFTINLTDQNTVIMKGCHALECRNGGFCDGHITTGPLCFCREGFSGTNCDKVAEMSVISSSQLLSFIGDFAIPVDIKCTVNQACPIPIYVFSKSTSVPKVLFGYVDAGINAEKPVLKLSRFFNTIFEGNATVYSNRSGVYKVCIQTSITRKTEDEICVSIEISTVAEKNDLLRPYFLPPTIPKESTVLCEINMTCHFHLHFTKGDAFGSPGECPTVKDTSPVRLPVHVFDSILESDECVSDISYLPQTVGARHILCVQIILPGHQGENRCFTIKSVINMSLEVISPCRAKSCANGGQCIANISVTPVNIQCVCQSGKSGDSCNSGETCDKTCLNGGSCGNGICHCRTGYSGDYCERVLDPCSSNPCVRGTCFHHIRQYYCMCPSGFTGDKCEININECFSQPCLNAGICVDNVGSFTCNCSSGFDGKLCEKDIDACLSLPCLNGGFCEDSIDKFFCQCRTGFEGDRCQNVVDPCMTNPCARGSCFSHQSQFLCRCPSGFTGRLCDESIYLSLNGPVETFLKVQHEGELLLNCSVSGVHPPKFHWTKLRACDTEVEKNKASVFHLSHVSFGSAGTYTCTASDGFSRNVTSYFHVEITTTSDQELCNFDDGGLCGWTQPTNDSFDWTIQNGPTQSDGTGPNADHTKGTSTGKYLYIESSSPRSFGEYADLLSPILPANQTMCFEFWYYMFGDGTGRLFVFLQDICLKKETQLFKLTGDQGQRWNRAAVTVTDKSVPNDYRVVVRADVGQTFHGDTAIDDPTTSRGICKGTQGASIVG